MTAVGHDVAGGGGTISSEVCATSLHVYTNTLSLIVLGECTQLDARPGRSMRLKL